MKASLLLVVGLAFAVSSIAPANAGKRIDRCNETTWRPAAEACPTVKPSSYTECVENYRKLGWKGSEREWCDMAEQQLKPSARSMAR
jgi:hypothetical protein